MISYGSDQTFTTTIPTPTVTTTAATAVENNSAYANGSFNPNGFETTVYFQWGTSASYGNTTTPTQAGNGTTTLTWAGYLSGLSANTIYHYRIVAYNAGGTSYGGDTNFTTLGPPPTVTTGVANPVATASATLNGTVNPNGSGVTAYFEWGTSTAYGNFSSTLQESGSSSIPISIPVSGLSPNTTYHFRIDAYVNGHASMISYGADQPFTTTTTPTVSTPLVTPDGGTFSNSVEVSLACPTTGATIYYTTDGTKPTTSSAIYSNPFTLNSSATVEAMATLSGYSNSAVASNTFMFTVATPTIMFTGSQQVSLACATTGATIYYTTNGTTVTTNSTVYRTPFTLNGSGILEAMATHAGYANSQVLTAPFTVTTATVATPTITPNGGTFNNSVQVSLACSTAGATIYYTTNGNPPTTSSTIYNNIPFTLNGSATLEAMAAHAGYSNSVVASASFTINPTQTPSQASGKVFSSSGSTINGASVRIGSAAAFSGGDGSYSITALSASNYAVTVSASGYTTLFTSLTVPVSDQVVQNFTLTPASGTLPTVTSVTTRYSPNGETLYFLDGVIFQVTFTATVNWGTHPAGTVQFITPNDGIYQVNANGGNTASTNIQVGGAFGPGGKLQVQAVSSDGASSMATVANFAVMPNELVPNPEYFSVVDEGYAFYYQYSAAPPFPFLSTDINTSIPDDIPILGGDSGGLQWAPTLNGKVNGNNATFSSSGVGFDASFNLGPVVPAADGLVVSAAVSPQSGLSLFEDYNLSSMQWQLSGGGVTLEGNVGLSYSVPIPLPPAITNLVEVNAEVALEVPFDGTLTITDLNPVALDGTLSITPTVSGSIGADVISEFSVEGSISGAINFNLQYPQQPTLRSYELSLSINASVYALGCDILDYNPAWTWPDPHPGLRHSLTVSGASISTAAHPWSRDYVKQPSYGAFNGEPSTGFARTVHRLGKRSGAKDALVYAFQTDVFPFSEPSISANGTNCYAVWLYDNTNRTAYNRTMLVFSQFNGTNWSTFRPVADDGTADFHPQLRTFADGSAVAAWENERTVLPINSDFTAMTTNLEIATAFYNPVAETWQTQQQLTTNGYLDRTPRIAGPSENNLMLVWVANTKNDLEGSAISVNQLWSATWDGSRWSAPQAFADVPYPLLKYDMAYDGTNAYVVMSVDADNTLTNVNSHELFEVAYQNGLWGGLRQLTTNQVPDDNPQLAIGPKGHIVLVWLQSNTLSSVVDFNFANQRVAATNQYSSNLADFRLANSSDGRLAIVWAAPSPQYSSDLWGMFYDPNFEVWGSPHQLTADPETEMGTAATFYSTNQLVALYDRLDIAVGDTKQIGSVITNADLYVLQYVLTNDLALGANSLKISPENPAPGNTVTLSVTAENLGDSAVSIHPRSSCLDLWRLRSLRTK
jgi:hypothetical protein